MMRYLLLYFNVMTFNMCFKCSYSSVFFSFPPKIDHGSVASSGDRDRVDATATIDTQ